MKKYTKIMTMMFLVFCLVGCGGKSNQSAQSSNEGATGTVNLKLSSAANEDSTWHVGVTKFKEIVEKETGGKFNITIFTNDQLSGGNQATGIELVQTGSTDIHLTDALVWSSIQPKAIVPAMPWLLPTYEDVDKHMSGDGGAAIKEALGESGVVCIGVGEGGYRQVVNTKHPIKTPDDMTGLKMRIPGSQLHVSLLKYLGADPITMSQSEVYTSLQQGAIDATENTLDLLLSQKTLEVVDNLTMWNYSYDPLYLTVSRKLWDSLNDEEKQIFTEAGEEAMKIQKEASREKEKHVLDEVKKDYQKVKIVESLSSEELKAFKEKTKPVYENSKKELGQELIESFGYKF